MGSCETKYKRIKIEHDSVFLITSREFKMKYYKQVLSELDIATTKNKNTLIKKENCLKRKSKEEVQVLKQRN